MLTEVFDEIRALAARDGVEMDRVDVFQQSLMEGSATLESIYSFGNWFASRGTWPPAVKAWQVYGKVADRVVEYASEYVAAQQGTTVAALQRQYAAGFNTCI